MSTDTHVLELYARVYHPSHGPGRIHGVDKTREKPYLVVFDIGDDGYFAGDELMESI